ncbi:CBS domain-containing protein [Haloplanus sp. GCM10025708]|uniref:CBS domain-containing protein n=1 Tax=Haloferacaceae TaxID=1644056 RepID=UPI00361673EE
MATARDIAASDVVTAARNDTLSDVAGVMRDEHVGSVVVEEESLPVESSPIDNSRSDSPTIRKSVTRRSTN